MKEDALTMTREERNAFEHELLCYPERSKRRLDAMRRLIEETNLALKDSGGSRIKNDDAGGRK